MKELTETFNIDNHVQEDYSQFQDNISNKMETSAIGGVGKPGRDEKRERSSISPNRIENRRIFANDVSNGNRGTDGLFKHKDLFNKA